VDGSRQAAWPLVRRDLSLSYADIGLLLTLPNFVSSLVEPPLALLGDTRHRRTIILTGGVCFALSLLLVSQSSGFASLLAAFVLFYPAGGAFVSLSQAALMDSAPARREQNMARWGFAGSLGIVAGSLALNAAVAAGATWRAWFGVLCGVSARARSLSTRPSAPPRRPNAPGSNRARWMPCVLCGAARCAAGSSCWSLPI
jgi:FSR family fosmidomycin resistance protein-like MFS transporter